jgi:hypothetical protein
LASKNPDSRLTMRFVGDPPRKCPIQRTSQKTARGNKKGPDHQSALMIASMLAL